MASTNSTTTPIADSSLPAGTNSSSTPFRTSTTNSQTTKSTAAGRSPDVWTTSTSVFVTVIYSTPKTSTLTIIVQTAGAISSGSPSFRLPIAVDPLTQPTTASVSEGAPNSVRSSTVSSAGKSQRQPSVAVLVVIGLVVASLTAGTFFLICRRRRRRKEVKHIFKRPESRSSFLDTDPFVSVAQNLAVMGSAEGEDQRKVFDAIMTPNWWEPVANVPLVFKPHSRKPRSLDESGATLSSQHQSQRSSPYFPATYPRIVFEQGGMIGGEAQLLERDETKQNLDRSSTFAPITYPLPPPRPPRSPRRKSNRSARPSLDSVSIAHSSSASPPYRPSPENRLVATEPPH